MSLSINQNIMAMNSYRNLSSTQNGLSKSLEKLSSGFRINRAADDAAGLAISEGLRSQVGGNKQAVRNAQDGISVVQTAEGALNEVHSILQRMRDLAVQGANDSNDAKARDNIHTELAQLRDELGRIGDATNFNGTKLLDGTASGTESLKFQVGANGDDASRITVDLKDADISKLSKDLSYDNYKTTDLTSKTTGTFAVPEDKDVTIRVDGKDYSFHTGDNSSPSTLADVAKGLQEKLDAKATGFTYTSGDLGIDVGKSTSLKIGDQTLTTAAATDQTKTPEHVVADLKEQIANNEQLNGKYDVSLSGGKLVVKSIGDSPVSNVAIEVKKNVTTSGTGDIVAQTSMEAGKAGSTVAGKFEVSVSGAGLKIATKDGSNMPADLVLTNDATDAPLSFAEAENADPLSVKDHASAQKLVSLLDEKISSVSTARANLGAVQNRFEHTINNLNVAVENLSASESRIRDTDMASEMMQFTRNQILSQAGTAMLAQANQVPQGVLSLLR